MLRPGTTIPAFTREYQSFGALRRDFQRGLLRQIRPNDWLSLDIGYRGPVRAEFANPSGAIEGTASARFDGRDDIIRITVKKLDAESPDGFSLQSTDPTLADFRRHGNLNRCTSVVVLTDHGSLTATEGVKIHKSEIDVPRLKSLELSALRSHFDVSDADTTKVEYWVLPLMNFVNQSWPGPWQELAGHPLRIFPTPAIGTGLSKEDLAKATEWANVKNRLLTFKMDGKPGFIERLPDYEERVAKLKAGKVANLITSVMVGPARASSLEWSDYSGLFPIDILNLLTLATGIRSAVRGSNSATGVVSWSGEFISTSAIHNIAKDTPRYLSILKTASVT